MGIILKAGGGFVVWDQREQRVALAGHSCESKDRFVAVVGLLRQEIRAPSKPAILFGALKSPTHFCDP